MQVIIAFLIKFQFIYMYLTIKLGIFDNLETYSKFQFIYRYLTIKLGIFDNLETYSKF